jgi:hypothetical protein
VTGFDAKAEITVGRPTEPIVPSRAGVGTVTTIVGAVATEATPPESVRGAPIVGAAIAFEVRGSPAATIDGNAGVIDVADVDVAVLSSTEPGAGVGAGGAAKIWSVAGVAASVASAPEAASGAAGVAKATRRVGPVFAV